MSFRSKRPTHWLGRVSTRSRRRVFLSTLNIRSLALVPSVPNMNRSSSFALLRISMHLKRILACRAPCWSVYLDPRGSNSVQIRRWLRRTNVKLAFRDDKLKLVNSRSLPVSYQDCHWIVRGLLGYRCHTYFVMVFPTLELENLNGIGWSRAPCNAPGTDGYDMLSWPLRCSLRLPDLIDFYHCQRFIAQFHVTKGVGPVQCTVSARD